MTFKHAYIYPNNVRPEQNGRYFTNTFSSTFSWMKVIVFCLKFHLRLFARVQLTISNDPGDSLVISNKPVIESMFRKIHVTGTHWVKDGCNNDGDCILNICNIIAHCWPIWCLDRWCWRCMAAILDVWFPITLTPYMVLPLFATRFAAYAGGIRVSFIQPCLF